MRYFVEISYDGTSYSGWQIQPNAKSIQEVIENALTTLLQSEISIVGCGRTDAGVHALLSYFHFDTAKDIVVQDLKHKLNLFLPNDISINNIQSVHKDAHARFDATARSYRYNIHFFKNPFLLERSYYFPQYKLFDIDKLHASANLLLEFEAFFPFCKTKSDAGSMSCKLTESFWTIEEGRITYKVTANRFLRGMVRLIVGMCLNVSMGKLELDHVRTCLVEQQRLIRDLSVPACGLYLSMVKYPYIERA